MAYLPHSILDYMSGNDMRLGVVITDGDGKVQVRSVTQETARIPHKQVLVDLGDAGKDARRELVNVQNKILDLMAEIDTGFIWENYVDTPGVLSLTDICETYYGDKEPLHISALARKLVEDVDHFQRVTQGPVGNVIIRSREESEEMSRLRQMRAAKAARREKVTAWVTQAFEYKGPEPFPVPEDMEGVVRATIDYLMCGANSDTVGILSRVRLKSSARDNAITLLKAVDRMPEDADEFLLSNGIHSGFTQAVLEYTQSLPENFPRDGRKEITNETIFSIDDEETREIDDALSCRRDGDEYIVGIYIADPACYVSKGDPLDEAAEDRPLSLYLPTTMVKMFPDHLSCGLASLNEGQARPSLVFTARLTKEAEVLDWSLAPSVVTVTKRLTYIEADKLLGEDGDSPLKQSMADLVMLANEMRKFREADGGITLNRPELKVRVKNNVVTVEREDSESPSHSMVAEFMVLANHLAAKYALRNDLPVIYRVQDPPSGPVSSVHKYEPYFFDQQVRKMKRTRLSTYPQPHFGLGLDLYIQISSPLRRYADLVMHRQLAAHCMGQKLPYTQEELFVVLDNVERTSGQNKALEKEANKYWLLEYIRRECLGKQMEATVMRVDGGLVLAELDYFCERGVVMVRDRPMLGEKITVTIKDAIPEAGRLVLQKD